MANRDFARAALLGTALASGAFVLAASGARAQTADLFPKDSTLDISQYYGRSKNTSVSERARPELEAIGIEEGGFTLFPRLDIGTYYVSNLFATATNTQSDEYVKIDPEIAAQSNWSRHGLRITASLPVEEYFSHSSEDELDYAVRADGKIDVYGQSVINLGASAVKSFEPRGNVYSTAATTVSPVEYYAESAYASGTYYQDRTRLTLTGQVNDFTYDNATLQGGGVELENTRNNTSWDISPRVDYALSPDTAAFIKGDYGQSRYEYGTAAIKRNSNTETVLGGVNFDLTSLARGEIGLGYTDRQYDSPLYSHLSGFAAAAKVEYFPTQLLTLTLEAQRRPQDAAFNSASGFFQNQVTGIVDYEIRRDWLVSGSAAYEDDPFVGISRADKVFNLGVATRYYFSRNLGIGANVVYSDRSSSGLFPGPSFKSTTVGVFLVLQR